jgi:hypothetical protein
MKKILAIIILSLCFMLPSKADDIKEFQLDVISLGDSALKYFTKNELKNSSEEFFYKNKTFKYYFLNTYKFKPYDGIQVTVKPNDPNYIIYGLDGVTSIKNFEECKIKMDDVSKELKKISSSRSQFDKGKHPMDKTGNSNYERIVFYFSNGFAEIICFDMSKKFEAEGKYDRFSVSLGLNEFRKFLDDVHYK